MFKSCLPSNKCLVLLFVFVIITSIRFSHASSLERLHNDEMADSSSDVAQEQQRRVDNLKQLRHFLLTSNAEQRAGRRDKQNFLKRKLIREYLRSVNDADSSRLEEVKKRFTYCSVQDMLHGSLCRRRAIHH
ncbi:unnamed protein product [Adineta ricciae]|uniref:Uncharacterized protein n=1 Tax=Adineta ricciae TaxID=249248 RepID=A0A815EV19_ADIRI|nr:unnamed protein product [Adineta ricciae]